MLHEIIIALVVSTIGITFRIAFGKSLEELLLQFIRTNKKQWLKDNPIVKNKIDRFFYRFNMYLYYPFFSFLFPVYGIIYSLFTLEYDALPRFTAAWICFGMGIASTAIFRYLKRDFHPPIKQQ